MDWWWYLLLIFTLFCGTGYLLIRLKVDLWFVFTYVVLSLINASVPLWEYYSTTAAAPTIPRHAVLMDASLGYLNALWGITFVMIDATFILAYAVYQWKVAKDLYWRSIIYLAIMVVGIHWFMGIWFADFGYFILAGLEYFNPIDAFWMPWFGPLPVLYWFATFIGVPLFAIGMGWAIKHRHKKELMTQLILV
jgi:hypothetical protein